MHRAFTFRDYFRKYKKLILAGVGALALVDVLEVLPPLLLKDAVDWVGSGRPESDLLKIAGLYAAAALGQALGRFGWRIFLIRASYDSARVQRDSFLGHVFRLSPRFFDKTSIGDLMSHATTDVDALRNAWGPGVLVLADAFVFLITVPIAMVLLSPRLTLLALLPMLIVPWIVWRNEREVLKRYDALQVSFGRLSALVQEGISGVRLLKAYAKEEAAIDRLATTGKEYAKLHLHLARVQSAFGPSLDFTISTGLLLILYFGGRDFVSPDGQALTLGTLIAFQRYIQKLSWPMSALGLAASTVQRAAAGSRRLNRIYAQTSEVADRSPSDLARFPSGAWKTAGRVEFERVSFKFNLDSDAVWAVRNFSLTVESGERVALVGPIGSGKSAVLSLLPRLYLPQEGKIRIDGTAIEDWPLEQLRQQIGFVSQDVFLLSESVFENVLLGSTPPLAPILAEDSSRLAEIHDEITRLERSYQTVLGERGASLSGGQRQRLTLARALALSPSILILDDPLSAVDVQTEEKILAQLRSRNNRKTELIAAHRISSIRDADRIVVMDRGEIRQVGTHAQLLADRRGGYRRYYEEQQIRAELDAYAL